MSDPQPYVKAMAARIDRLIFEGVHKGNFTSLEDEVRAQHEEWETWCRNLGVDPHDPKMKLCGLIFLQYLLEVLTAQELGGGEPQVAQTIRSLAFTMALGVFGDDYIEAHKED